MNRKMYFFSIGALLFSVGFVFLIFFWQVAPYKTVEVNKEVTVTPKKVETGGHISLHTDFCIYTTKPIKVKRDLVGETVIISIPPKIIEVILPRGCSISDGLIELPKTRNAGTYRIIHTATVQVNPVKEVTITWTSEPFEVTVRDTGI